MCLFLILGRKSTASTGFAQVASTHTHAHGCRGSPTFRHPVVGSNDPLHNCKHSQHASAAPSTQRPREARARGKQRPARLLPALRSTLRAVGCQATMPTLFEWPSKMTTGSVRERVSPFSGICHTCWQRKKGHPHESGRLPLPHLLWPSSVKPCSA